MKEPVDHVLRPMLPWRSDGAMTECGLNASKVSTLSREAYFARLKDFGQQRCAMLTCMTCADTARRWGTWEDDPRRALEREIQWESAWRRDDRGVRLRDELLAIAALIEAHRDEFDAQLNATEQRRAWLEKKAENAKTKKAPDYTKGRGL
jgi:hypothetical protein